MTSHGAGPTPGWYAVGNLGSQSEASFSMILDAHGTPVWYRRTPEGDVALVNEPAGGVGFRVDPSQAYNIDDLGVLRSTAGQ